jgi:endoglucanase
MPLIQPLASLLSRYEAPPEKIDSRTATTSGGMPIGFSAAVLPFLFTMDEDTAVKQRQRLKNSRVRGVLGDPPHYYDQALAMFGEGWDSRRFRFGESGEVIPRWERSCCDWLYRAH